MSFMLLSYRKEIFRPECNSTFQSLHCIARLDQDIGEVLPIDPLAKKNLTAYLDRFNFDG